VGLDGEEIHVDEWGRIKVRFLFTRTDDHQHDGLWNNIDIAAYNHEFIGLTFLRSIMADLPMAQT
jgi:hypothetical protein